MKYKSPLFKCPVMFYKCKNNVAVLDKLVSGYYVAQKLSDGNYIRKPKNMVKCSHGGFVDEESYTTHAQGGINKDSGYYLFSPRADLHSTAANLAIRHTEYFFNQFRLKYGDEEYAELLKLKTSIGNLVEICAGNSRFLNFKSSSSSVLVSACFWLIKFLLYKYFY